MARNALIATLERRTRKESDGELDEEQQRQRDILLNTLKTEIKAIHKLFDGKKEIGTHSLPLGEKSEGNRKFIAVFADFVAIQRPTPSY